MKLKLIRKTDNMMSLFASVARLCTSNTGMFDKELEDEADIKRLVEHLLKYKHLSVFEHGSITFGTSLISRISTHQLVRHRIASYTQQSQRYTNSVTLSPVIPPKVKQNEKTLEVFKEATDLSMQAYDKLMKMGVPKEDARYVLPHSMESNIIVTMNMRSVGHFIKLRGGEGAQWEIIELAELLKDTIKEIEPVYYELMMRYIDNFN